MPTTRTGSDRAAMIGLAIAVILAAPLPGRADRECFPLKGLREAEL